MGVFGTPKITFLTLLKQLYLGKVKIHLQSIVEDLPICVEACITEKVKLYRKSIYHNAPQLQNPVDMGRPVCLEARGEHQSITLHQIE